MSRHSDNSTDCTTTEQIRILRPAGRNLISQFDIFYDENDRLTVKEAVVIQPDGKRIALAESQIHTEPAPDSDGGWGRSKKTSLAFPGLKQGSVASYKTELHAAAVPRVDQLHDVILLPSNPIRYDSYRLEYVADRRLFSRSEAMEDFAIAPSDDGRQLVVELKKPRYFHVIDEDDNELRVIPRLEIGTSERAGDYFYGFAKIYNDITSAKLPPRAAAVVAGIRGKPERERVVAVMNYIASQFRYMGDWRSNERGFAPFGLSEIEANGYGDCKDLAVMLTAMLDASDIPAEPALVFSGSFAPTLLIPGSSAPNHAIVRATVDGKIWWLDPTNSVLLPGFTHWNLQDRWAFVLQKNGEVHKDYIAAEEPLVTVDSIRDVRFNKDGTAQVKGEAYVGGAVLLALQFSDHAYGISASDQTLCGQWVGVHDKCRIERPMIDALSTGRYQLKTSMIDRKALAKVSGHYVYDGAHTQKEWERFDRYRQNGDAGDIYLGDAEISQSLVRLENVTFSEPVEAC